MLILKIICLTIIFLVIIVTIVKIVEYYGLKSIVNSSKKIYCYFINYKFTTNNGLRGDGNASISMDKPFNIHSSENIKKAIFEKNQNFSKVFITDFKEISN